MTRFLEWLLDLQPGKLAGGDWRIGFVAEHNDYIRLGLLAVLAVLVWLTVRNYRREGDVRPRIKKLCAAMRIAVIILVVAILFQPAVVLRVTETLYSSVLVLVDNSMSMQYADRYTDGEQTGVGESLRAQLSPGQSLDETPRIEIVRHRLGRPDGVLARLAEDHPVELLRFSTGEPGSEAYTEIIGSIPLGGDITSPPPAPATTRPAGASPLATLQADGYETRLSTAVRDALDRFQGRRIAALVVVSDGQPTQPGWADRLDAAGDYAQQRGVPRLAVLVGDPTPPKNIAVTAVRAPREIRRESDTEVQVLLNHRNLAGETVEVALFGRPIEEDWPEELSSLPPLATQSVTLQAAGEDAAEDARVAQSVTLNFKPETLGDYAYRAYVAPRGDELTDKDNHADALMKVTDSKIRILLISGDAGWEFQYLRNYFLRQPELYRVSVWQQNADPEINQSASSGMKLTRLPRSLRELIDSGTPGEATPPPATQPADAEEGDAPAASEPKDAIPPGYHVVILYDPHPTAEGFDEEFMKLLETYVTVHRGGLCYIASNKNSYDVLKDPAAKPLANLLPVTLARNEIDVRRAIIEGVPEALPVVLTSYGVDHPVTKLVNSSDDNRNIWSVLPSVYWSHAVTRRKPAARVLAENPTRTTQMRGEAEPMVAVQAAGSGRVVYVGFDETWRWRFVEDGFYHRRFWGNVVRYLAPLNARQVIISTGGDRFSAGEKITIEVEAFDREFRPLGEPAFTVRMINTQTGEVQVHELDAIKNRPGQYRTTIVAAHTGSFELTGPEGFADASQMASKQITIELPQAETRRTEANRRVMASLASKPEYLLGIENVEQLDELIPPGQLEAVEYERHMLWDTELMWILIATLLAAEWFIRKRNNMA
jgi:hypothetical protein